MTAHSYYSQKPRPVGRYASALEASWALHLRSMCDTVNYAGATHQSFDFLICSGQRQIAVEIKPQLQGDESAAGDAHNIPTIVYSAAARAYRRQVEQVRMHGLVVTLIATGFPESAAWYLVLSETDDRRYRHQHMRGSKRIFGDDINARSKSEYTIYVLDGRPDYGDNLTEWVKLALQACNNTIDISDHTPLSDRAQRIVSDKQKRKLMNRARQATRCQQAKR